MYNEDNTSGKPIYVIFYRVHKTCHPSSDLNLKFFNLPHFSAMCFLKIVLQSNEFTQMYIEPASLVFEAAPFALEDA